MNDNDFYTALGASIDGKGNIASIASMYGASQYHSLRSTERVMERMRPSRDAAIATGPGILDDAAEFAAKWTDNIIDFVSSGFTWVPTWTALVFKATGVFAFLVAGVHLECTGLLLLVMAAIGWFAPLMVKFLCRLTLGLTLMSLYLCFLILTVVLVLGIAFGILAVLAAVFGS